MDVHLVFKMAKQHHNPVPAPMCNFNLLEDVITHIGVCL